MYKAQHDQAIPLFNISKSSCVLIPEITVFQSRQASVRESGQAADYTSSNESFTSLEQPPSDCHLVQAMNVKNTRHRGMLVWVNSHEDLPRTSFREVYSITSTAVRYLMICCGLGHGIRFDAIAVKLSSMELSISSSCDIPHHRLVV
jgi:hypothetical protein